MSVIPPALRTLLRLRVKGRIRRLKRDLATVRGALLFAVGFGMFALWLLPMTYTAIAQPSDPEILRSLFPFLMLGFILLGLITSAGEHAIYFSPAEVAFLFPGPFSRRQLLAYRLVSTQAGMLFTSLVFSLFMMRFSTWWFVTFIGVFLSFQFVYLFGLLLMLISENVAERAYTRFRRAVIVTGLAVIAVSVWRAVQLVEADDLVHFAQTMRESPLAAVLLLPLEPFGRLVTAHTLFPDAVLYGMTALAINAGLTGLVMALDTNYLERAAGISEKYYARIARAQRGGGLPLSARANRWRVPPLPRWGGAGAVMWRQLSGALRGGRTLLFLAVPVLLLVGVLASGRSGGGMTGWGAAGAVIVWITILFASALRFDFRGDLDQLELLKSLPIRPLTLSLGQIAVPVAVCLAMQTFVVGIVAVQSGPLWIVPVFLLAAVPLNICIFAIENLVFLLMPMRVIGRGPGDFQFMGRQLALLLCKLIVLGVAFAAASVVGGAIYLVAGPQWVLIGVSVWIVLMAEALALLPLVAWAFMRHDPSVHTPV